VLGWIEPEQVSGVSAPASAALPVLARVCCVDFADVVFAGVLVFGVPTFGAAVVLAVDGVVAGVGVGSAYATPDGPTLNASVATTAVRRLT